jgi:hypothetical protein
MQQPVLGIVPFAAVGTLQIAAPRRALMVIVLGDRKVVPQLQGTRYIFKRVSTLGTVVGCDFDLEPGIF